MLYFIELIFDDLSFNNSIYLSEKDSADRNYCLGYMMQEKGAFLNGKNINISKKINRNDLMGIGIFFLWIGLLVWLSTTK